MSFTGSAVGRVVACPASVVYPATDHGDAGGYAAMGEDLHAGAEVAVDTGDLDALPPRVAAMIAELPTRLTEVAFVYDAATDTARMLTGIGKRQYPTDLGPYETAMTLDLLALSGPDGARRAAVVDYKLYADGGPPLQHGQLMTQALAVARTYGLDEVAIAIAYLGTGWVDAAVATALDLDLHAERLRQVHVDVAAARKDPAAFTRTGAHCKHCPAFHACPEQVALAELVRSPDMADAIEARIPIGDDDEGAAELYGFVKRLKLLTSRAEQVLAARARERPIPLADGRSYGPVPTVGNDKLDGEKVYQAAAAIYGSEHAMAFVEVKATKKRIKEAAKLTKQIGGKAATAIGVERLVLAEVEARGGILRGAVSYPLREHTEPELIEATALVRSLETTSDDMSKE